ncbi:hypothetical protein GGI12_001829 [Dipsacomyces acuminosporus]|nr:hypothetical protein GGI12_001829 [Dipsacomyces acuminosporus]
MRLVATDLRKDDVSSPPLPITTLPAEQDRLRRYVHKLLCRSYLEEVAGFDKGFDCTRSDNESEYSFELIEHSDAQFVCNNGPSTKDLSNIRLSRHVSPFRQQLQKDGFSKSAAAEPQTLGSFVSRYPKSLGIYGKQSELPSPAKQFSASQIDAKNPGGNVTMDICAAPRPRANIAHIRTSKPRDSGTVGDKSVISVPSSKASSSPLTAIQMEDTSEGSLAISSVEEKYSRISKDVKSRIITYVAEQIAMYPQYFSGVYMRQTELRSWAGLGIERNLNKRKLHKFAKQGYQFIGDMEKIQYEVELQLLVLTRTYFEYFSLKLLQVLYNEGCLQDRNMALLCGEFATDLYSRHVNQALRMLFPFKIPDDSANGTGYDNAQQQGSSMSKRDWYIVVIGRGYANIEISIFLDDFEAYAHDNGIEHVSFGGLDSGGEQHHFSRFIDGDLGFFLKTCFNRLSNSDVEVLTGSFTEEVNTFIINHPANRDAYSQLKSIISNIGPNLPEGIEGQLSERSATLIEVNTKLKPRAFLEQFVMSFLKSLASDFLLAMLTHHQFKLPDLQATHQWRLYATSACQVSIDHKIQVGLLGKIGEGQQRLSDDTWQEISCLVTYLMVEVARRELELHGAHAIPAPTELLRHTNPGTYESKFKNPAKLADAILELRATPTAESKNALMQQGSGVCMSNEYSQPLSDLAKQPLNSSTGMPARRVLSTHTAQPTVQTQTIGHSATQPPDSLQSEPHTAAGHGADEMERRLARLEQNMLENKRRLQHITQLLTHLAEVQ